jgi:radical SAM-linked protein
LGKLLVQYGKTGPLKYLSHLELLRAFERSFRRAGLEILLSGGFNPRPKVSYGSALSVGVSSVAEFLTIELADCPEPKDVLNRISSTLPEGLRVYRAKYIPLKGQSIMSAVQSQEYSVKVINCSNIVLSDIALIEESVDHLLNKEQLMVRHKEKEKWVETKKAILNWKVNKQDKTIADSTNSFMEFNLLLSVGDGNVIRPEAAMGLLFAELPDGGRCEIIDICRVNQYVNRDIPLNDIYEFYESVKMGSEC